MFILLRYIKLYLNGRTVFYQQLTTAPTNFRTIYSETIGHTNNKMKILTRGLHLRYLPLFVTFLYTSERLLLSNSDILEKLTCRFQSTTVENRQNI